MKKYKKVKTENRSEGYISSLIIDLKSMNKKNYLKILRKRIKLIMIIILVVFASLGYFAGTQMSSESLVLKKLESCLKDGDVSRLSKIVRVNYNDVSKDELEPLIKYYEDSSSRVDDEIKLIKADNSGNVFELSESKSLFGTKYYFNIKTYSVIITSNFNDAIFTIGSLDSLSSGSEIDGIIPGCYSVNGVIKSQWSDDITASKDIVILGNENLTINFDAINITVSSEYNDAEIYINDEDSGIIVNDASEIGPFKTDGSVSVYLQREFPWGTIDGDKTYIYDTPNINLTINMLNDTLESEIEDASGEFYESVFEALNKEDSSKIESATDTAKNKIYGILEKQYTILKNEYTINNIDIDNDKCEYYYEDGEYKANIIVEVQYEVQKKLFGLNKSSSTKLFLTNFIYDDGEWKVEEVENFELDVE